MSVANQTPPNVASDYATILFVVRQLMGGMATAALVRVQACTNDGGVVPVGTIDAQLLVDMQTEDGQTIPHGTLFRVPYTRAQGGTNAVILDPQPGDIGVCVFASRDISAVKKQPDAARNRTPTAGATPGSKRMFSLADGLYVGGLLNGAPEQYVQFNDEGITILSPTAVTIEAPVINLKGEVVQTDGSVSVETTLTAGTDVVANGVSLHDHTHNGVQTGGGDTGPPNT